MPIIIDVPGLASSAVDWPVVPSVPASFPLDGLVSYLAIQNAPLNGDGRVAALNRFIGADNLVQNINNRAPTIEPINGQDTLRYTPGVGDRLVAAGGSWNWGAATGLTFLFPVRVNAVSGVKVMLNAGGFRLRLNEAGGVNQLQVRKAISGGVFSTDTSAFDFTSFCVLGVTFDDAANNVRVYRNGVLTRDSTALDWGSVAPTGTPVWGAEFDNGSNAPDANYGDFIRYDRALSGGEMTAASAYLMNRFGIS